MATIVPGISSKEVRIKLLLCKTAITKLARYRMMRCPVSDPPLDSFLQVVKAVSRVTDAYGVNLVMGTTMHQVGTLLSNAA